MISIITHGHKEHASEMIVKVFSAQTPPQINMCTTTDQMVSQMISRALSCLNNSPHSKSAGITSKAQYMGISPLGRDRLRRRKM